MTEVNEDIVHEKIKMLLMEENLVLDENSILQSKIIENTKILREIHQLKNKICNHEWVRDTDSYQVDRTPMICTICYIEK